MGEKKPAGAGICVMLDFSVEDSDRQGEEGTPDGGDACPLYSSGFAARVGVVAPVLDHEPNLFPYLFLHSVTNRLM
jgi:hypothetical protein